MLHKTTENIKKEAFTEQPGFQITFHPFMAGRGVRPDGMDTGWRSLPAPLIEIPSGGAWELWLEGEAGPMILNDGQAMVIPAGLKHRLRCRANEKMETFFLLAAFRRMGIQDIISAADIPLAHPSAVGIRLRTLIDRMASLLEGGWPRSFLAAARLHKLAFEILSALMEFAARGEPVYDDHAMGRLSKVLKIMGENPAAKHSCRELAAMAGFSPSRFNAVFRGHLGAAPKVYLRGLRLRQASALLLSGDGRTQEIADKCGFCSSAYFCRFFKAHTGMSPAAFRAAFGPAR
jgi:AraC-like DNA-binding protein